MSHFVVVVLGEDHEKLLEPYDENIDVEPYVAAGHEEGLAQLARAREVLADPAYAENYQPRPTDPSDDDQVMRWWTGGDWQRNADGQWERWSTYNPKSQWDWYVVGGRWSGAVSTMPSNVGTVADLLIGDDGKPYVPFAVVCPEGTWHERGRMGWWGVVTGEKNQGTWEAQVETIYESVPADTKAVLVDAHI